MPEEKRAALSTSQIARFTVGMSYSLLVELEATGGPRGGDSEAQPSVFIPSSLACSCGRIPTASAAILFLHLQNIYKNHCSRQH